MKKLMVGLCYLRLSLGIETASCRLFLRMARMDMDWNFKRLNYACQNSQKIFSQLYKGILCMG